MKIQRVVQTIDEGNLRTVSNPRQTEIAPRLFLKQGVSKRPREQCARVHLEVSPDTPVLSFAFLNEHLARKAMHSAQFLSCALWKALPMMDGEMIDEVIDSFVRSEDLYDTNLTFNKMADHCLREAGVFCISPANVH